MSTLEVEQATKLADFTSKFQVSHCWVEVGSTICAAHRQTPSAPGIDDYASVLSLKSLVV